MIRIEKISITELETEAIYSISGSKWSYEDTDINNTRA